jgi:hypothetical protein
MLSLTVPSEFVGNKEQNKPQPQPSAPAPATTKPTSAPAKFVLPYHLSSYFCHQS